MAGRGSRALLAAPASGEPAAPPSPNTTGYGPHRPGGGLGMFVCENEKRGRPLPSSASRAMSGPEEVGLALRLRSGLGAACLAWGHCSSCSDLNVLLLWRCPLLIKGSFF